MTRQEFHALYLNALEQTTRAAELQFGRSLSRHFGVLRDSPREDGRRVTPDEAFDEIWLGEDRYYCIVDVVVVEASPSKTWLWIRESGHPPEAYEKTWNQPPGSGPFKTMLPMEIRSTV